MKTPDKVIHTIAIDCLYARFELMSYDAIDLTARSLEDTEKLRRKYVRSKRFYEDKVQPHHIHVHTLQL